MSVVLEKKIAELRQKLTRQCIQVQSALDRAIASLHDFNATEAAAVIEGDEAIDRLEIEIEDLCLELLALHHPVADDLRYIVGVLRINSDIERIGDQAANIAKRVTYLSAHPRIAVPLDMETMTKRAVEMVQGSIRALNEQDATLARAVGAQDDYLDQMRREGQNRLTEQMSHEPEHSEVLVRWMAVVRHVERVGDMATNISEDVIYMVEGRIVRHGWKPPDETEED